MEPRSKEPDYEYLRRFNEQLTEVGKDAKDPELIWLHIFLESFPPEVKAKVREQPELPKNRQDLVALITKLRPSIKATAGQAPHGQNKSNAGVKATAYNRGPVKPSGNPGLPKPLADHVDPHVERKGILRENVTVHQGLLRSRSQGDSLSPRR
ncbi:hypothetical protein BDV10DRAFT_190533 [Aspergillus recurvatus]